MATAPQPAPAPLTPDTLWLVDHFFKPADRLEARRVLEQQIARQLPFCEKADDAALERLRFAAIKVSDGNLKRLHHTVREAQKDWRDLLMGADFGFRVTDHRNWFEGLRRGD